MNEYSKLGSKIDSYPKCCKKDMADMLKKPSKATRFHSDTHDCKSHSKCFLDRSWQATLEVSKESLAGVFHHICHVNNDNLMQLMSY